MLYTLLIVSLNVISQGGGSNLYPPEMEGTFTPAQIADRIFGSKIVVVSEQAMLNVIYCLKACMLVMYTRLTLGLNTQKWVRVLAVYVGLGWLGTEIAFFTACRPFTGYWAMPVVDHQCATLEIYAYIQGCFNISGDICMLFIPLPLVIKMHAPWRQKAVLVLIFSMGFFVIIAALLTKIFNLTNIWDPSYMLWYVREASVAIYVANLPMIWPLLRDWFPCLRNLTPGGYTGSSGSPSHGKGAGQRMGTARSHVVIVGGNTSRSRTGGVLSSSRVRHHASLGSLDSTYDLEMAMKETSPRRLRGGEASSSTEEIVGGDDATGATGRIKVERTIVIEEELSPRRSGYDEDKQEIFDWKQMGRAEHTVDASRAK